MAEKRGRMKKIKVSKFQSFKVSRRTVCAGIPLDFAQGQALPARCAYDD
jgi:hypothetical protein